jgi:predicted O-linked N-acetylglucosamine transferase (SPINDLY family)
VRNLDDESLADRIRRDRIDVLVDLSGHTRNNRLLVFARRPAALQVSWLGYLNTTGMRAMDWRIIAEDAELPGSEKYHSARLWTLPGFPWPWVPPEDVPKELDCDSGLGAQRDVTFGSFNAFRKLNGRVLAAWAEILRDVPGSRLHIYGVPSGMCVERTHELFEGWGIEAQRVSVFGKLDYQRYLSAYDEIDIALDTFPYTGGATTCESLWMGVPLITLAGAGGFGRSSTCFVRGIGFPELACESIEQYQRAAVDLALNDQSPLRRRREFRERVRAKLDPSPENFIRGLEAAFFGMLAHARDRGLLTC